MIFQTIALIVVVLVFLAIPVWLVSFIRQPYRSLPRGEATGAVGGAVDEIDRILARPSVEHKVDAENKIQQRDDDVGGE